ncbi:MAG: OmpA family protein [Oligoflexia bacterium]|nr:OmpA family protein [Oligoflexia bacterium]
MKSNQLFRRLAVTIAILSFVSAAGCAGKKTVETDSDSIPNAIAADENTTGDSDSGKAMGLQTVQFPYDSFTLDAEGKQLLEANAQILKDKGSAKIQIEGHCDQRGGIQYNIALGEKRANATKGYLVDKGIAADRITTISFGKERPIDPATTEEAYAKNRRANFVITSK